MSVLLGVFHPNVFAPKPTPFGLIDMQMYSGESERFNGGSDFLKINTQVDQRGQGHVAADTGGAIKIRNSHDGSPF